MAAFPKGRMVPSSSEQGGLKNYSVKRVGRCSLDTLLLNAIMAVLSSRKLEGKEQDSGILSSCSAILTYRAWVRCVFDSSMTHGFSRTAFVIDGFSKCSEVGGTLLRFEQVPGFGRVVHESSYSSGLTSKADISSYHKGIPHPIGLMLVKACSPCQV